MIEEYLNTLDEEERHHVGNLRDEITKAIDILGSKPTLEDWALMVGVLRKEKNATRIDIHTL